jgi:YVTN family beta-propeller protein
VRARQWAGAAVVALGLLARPLVAQGARLYVANQDDATVSVIDIATNAVIETVDLRRYGFGDNARPHHAQVEPDGSAWYVTLIGAGKVLKLDARNQLLASADLEVPGLMALHPTEDLLFVGRSMSAVNPPPSVAIVRRSDMTVVDEIGLIFPRPHAIVVGSAGRRVYIASLGVNQLASMAPDGSDVRLVDVPGAARGFVQAAVSPDGQWLAVTAELTDELLIFSLADAALPKLERAIPMPDGPFEPVFTLDGRWIYVTNLAANRVTVVDVSRWAPVDTIEHEGFVQPHGVALSPDGAVVYVGSRHQSGGVHDHAGGKPTGKGTVVAICAASHRILSSLTVGAYAAGMGAPVAGPRSRSTPNESCR